jgi:activator of Hsp90 ATPase-like protein
MNVALYPIENPVHAGAWRFPAWEPGTFSIVRFSLVPAAGGTRLVIHEHGEPEDWHDHIDTNVSAETLGGRPVSAAVARKETNFLSGNAVTRHGWSPAT